MKLHIHRQSSFLPVKQNSVLCCWRQTSKPGFDSSLIVMATHLDWKKDPAIRLEQVRRILEVSIGAVLIKILAGDFNSVRNEHPLKEIEYFFNPIKKDDTDDRSWPAVNPALDIDHIFTLKGQKWNIRKLEIPHDNKNFMWSSVSDHLPVIAGLKLVEQLSLQVIKCRRQMLSLSEFGCWGK